MIGIHKSLLSNVFLAPQIADFVVKFSHLIVGEFDEVSIDIFTEVGNFRVQVNSEPFVCLKMLSEHFNLATKIPLEVFDKAVQVYSNLQQQDLDEVRPGVANHA